MELTKFQPIKLKYLVFQKRGTKAFVRRYDILGFNSGQYQLEFVFCGEADFGSSLFGMEDDSFEGEHVAIRFLLIKEITGIYISIECFGLTFDF